MRRRIETVFSQITAPCPRHIHATNLHGFLLKASNAHHRLCFSQGVHLATSVIEEEKTIGYELPAVKQNGLTILSAL